MTSATTHEAVIDLTDTESVRIDLPGGIHLEIDPYKAIGVMDAIAEQGRSESAGDDEILAEEIGGLHEWLVEQAGDNQSEMQHVIRGLNHGQLYTLHTMLFRVADQLNEQRQKKTESIACSLTITPASPATSEAGVSAPSVHGSTT